MRSRKVLGDGFEFSNVGGNVVHGDNISFNVTVTDDNYDVESVWLKTEDKV